MSGERRVLLGLEAQIPYHSRKIFNGFISFIKDYQPTEIICIGDFLDCPAPSRWNRGTAQEYGSKLQDEVNTGRGILEEIRDVFDGPFGFHTGNHEARINTYAKTKAPALAGLDCLEVKNLLEFDKLSIDLLPTVNGITQGWVSTHGDIAPLSKYSGGTAVGLARRLRRSVVCGHTHRLGWIQESDGGGTLHGIETGHMMDTTQAAYILHGTPNWQAGWVTLDISGQLVKPQIWNVSTKGNWYG